MGSDAAVMSLCFHELWMHRRAHLSCVHAPAALACTIAGSCSAVHVQPRQLRLRTAQLSQLVSATTSTPTTTIVGGICRPEGWQGGVGVEWWGGGSAQFYRTARIGSIVVVLGQLLLLMMLI